MELKELAGKKVALWGMGVEGRAVQDYLRKRLPALQPAIIDNNPKIADAIHKDDADTLSQFEIIIKSPGISPNTENVKEAQRRGTQFISATNLWFANERRGKIFGVTGTKGKSTTTSLLAYILKGLGYNAAAAGNIGIPLISHEAADDSITILEMSSFQSTGFKGVLDGMIITSLFPEHMDWHNGEENYFHDKMTPLHNMNDQPVFIPSNSVRVDKYTSFYKNRIVYNQPDSFHVRGSALYFEDKELLNLADTNLAGPHNLANICGILKLCETLGIKAEDTLPFIKSYLPLPHRLQTIAQTDKLRCVDDSIATSPYAALASIASFPEEDNLAIIMGGYDRGISWDEFGTLLKPEPNMHFFVMGLNRQKILDALAPHKSIVKVTTCENMIEATKQGFYYLAQSGKGVLLLAPGSPSYDQFNSYAERGDKFKEICTELAQALNKEDAA
ncbi:MAG: UDP-N-acetylmuramoyl-L-alanine--D-glutamate ligase [Alphaproteobacteria bacterium]|nr:UDP-N-acetylmuramoyl-L-alanine--D-glutamate ligase [Alphaproteobacteria bacterium]